MAITASSFRRGTSGGAASFRGMRRFSPKDTSNLLKTVDAINKNLVAINRLLQQQTVLAQKTQLQQQRQKRIERENIAKQSAESAIETTKASAKNIMRGLKSAAKNITGKINNFLKPFITFFAITFVGWFSKGVMAWFSQEKDKKQKQLKEWVPKILKTLAIVGGVIAALQFGLPLLLSALGTLIGTLPIVLGALLNPITWKVLLAAGAGIALSELFERGMEGLDPGQRARERVRRILNKEAASGSKFGLELVNANERTGTKGDTYYDQFYKIGDKLYRASDINSLLNSPTAFNKEFKTYEKTKDGKTKEIGTEQVNAEAIKEQKALAGLVGDQRKQILGQLATNRLSGAYKEYFRVKKALEDNQSEIKRRENFQSGRKNAAGSMEDAQNAAKLKTLRENTGKLQNDMKFARNTVSTMYNQLSGQQKDLLQQKLGIKADQLFPESLTEAQTAYAMRGALNFVTDMVEAPLGNVVSMMENFQSGIAEQFNALTDTISDFEINFNVNPVVTDDTDRPGEVPAGGVGINPFDMENPFLQFAKQNYVLLGVM
jgi:hypothetical protein